MITHPQRIGQQNIDRKIVLCFRSAKIVISAKLNVCGVGFQLASDVAK